MRVSRRAVRASLRLLWTLLLVVFSAHHAAPNAPIWHGADSGHAGHGHSSELAFTAIDANHHSHCELCFTSAFSPPVTLSSVPRVALINPRAAKYMVNSSFSTDLRLPEAHAPPRT